MYPTTTTSAEFVDERPNMKLFWACFIALVTTSFGFILRALTLTQWGEEFNLTNTQIGEISGVGLWPFAISIVIFSLVIDKIGYKKSMIFAFACHVLSAILTFYADGYSMLYIATFIMAIGNGTVEAVVNPVIASMFVKEKTKWLNMLHAGWPTGLVMGGVIALFMGVDADWRYKIILVLLPTIVYGIMMIRLTIPKNERVKAGVSYLEMLKEVGVGGIFIVVALIVFQLGAVFQWSFSTNLIITFSIVAVFGFYVRSFGRPLFIFLLLMMIPLATTELGTDSWISDLMAPEMEKIGIQGGWILVYTSAIMAILRLTSGKFIHKITPLGLLALCSLVAAVGLFLLSSASGIMVLVAATIFGLGKTFFWPTMLGVVGERFPKGGALTLNITGGVGMIGAGVIGAVILGFIQDKSIEKNIYNHDEINNTSLYDKYVIDEKQSIFGSYNALNTTKLLAGETAERKKVDEIRNLSKKETLQIIAIFPVGMLFCYLLLMLYFRLKGGYKVIVLGSTESSKIKKS